jgi:hypothetical protein
MSRVIVASLILLTMASEVSVPLVAQNGNPPQNVTMSSDLYPGAPFGSCSFPINISSQGKGKSIFLPRGNMIFTSPGLDATVTNLINPSKQMTLNITGSFHVSTTSDGGSSFVVTGRNLLTDPSAGVVLAVGNFSFAFDAKGNLTQPLTMQGGTLMNLCAWLQ